MNENKGEKNLLSGPLVSLRPLTPDDKELFYRWATNSDSTPYWYGPLYGDAIPTRDAFFDDWQEYYFDGSRPEKGRSYAIVERETQKEIGEINYQVIDDPSERIVYDLDILIARDVDKGKGYGSQALILLIRHLKDAMHAKHFCISGLKENQRAVGAYRKAGFTVAKEVQDEKGRTWTVLKMDVE